MLLRTTGRLYWSSLLCVVLAVLHGCWQQYHGAEHDSTGLSVVILPELSSGTVINNKYQLIARFTTHLSPPSPPVNTDTHADTITTIDYTGQLLPLPDSVDDLESLVCSTLFHRDADDHTQSTGGSQRDHTYRLHEQFSAGAYGQLYFARRTDADEAESVKYVLKRLHSVDRSGDWSGYHVRASGLREIHFGVTLRDHENIVQFVEHFQVDNELWLVFEYGGVSLYGMCCRLWHRV